MIQEKKIQIAPTLSRSYIDSTSTYTFELSFSESNGLIMTIFDTSLKNLGYQLYLTISDDLMNEVLRNAFDTTEDLFNFLMHRDHIFIDIQNRTIRLKIIKFVGKKQIDQSINLKLQRRAFSNHAHLYKSFKRDFEKVQQKIRTQENILQEKQGKLLNKIKELQTFYNINKTNLNALNMKLKFGIGLTILVMLVVIILLLCCKIATKVNDPWDNVKLQLLKIMDMKISESDSKFLQDLQIKVNKSIQQSQKVNKSIQQSQMKVKKSIQQSQMKVKKSIQQSQIRLNNIQKTLIQSQKRQKSQISRINISIQQMLQKFIKLQSNSNINNQPQVLNPHHNRPVKELQTKIQQVYETIKRLSIFDLTSKFIDKFQIKQNAIVCLAPTGIRTQFLLRKNIPYGLPFSYKIRIDHSPSNSIFMGVVDAIRLKERTSLQHINTVAYSGRGQLWKNGIKQSGQFVKISQGQIITVHIQLSKGLIKWIVDDKTVMQTQSQRLKDNTIKFRPYIEMSSKRDTIEIIQTDME